MKTLKKMSKKERTDALFSVAEEVMKICNFETKDAPPETGSKKELTEWLTEAYQELEPNDKLSKEAVAIFAELEISPAPEKESKKESEVKDENEKVESKATSKTKEKKEGKKSTKSTGKKVSLSSKIDFFAPLIKQGKHSQKELTELGVKEFPTITGSTIRTFLTDSKNEKYNKFNKLVIINKKGNLSFE